MQNNISKIIPLLTNPHTGKQILKSQSQNLQELIENFFPTDKNLKKYQNSNIRYIKDLKNISDDTISKE